MTAQVSQHIGLDLQAASVLRAKAISFSPPERLQPSEILLSGQAAYRNLLPESPLKAFARRL
jgi:hypothetical protein